MKRTFISDGNVRYKVRAMEGYRLDRKNTTLRRIRIDMVYGYDGSQRDLIGRARDLGIDETQIIQAAVEGHRSGERRR